MQSKLITPKSSLESYLDLLPRDLLENLTEIYSEFGLLMPGISRRLRDVYNNEEFAKDLLQKYIGPNYNSVSFTELFEVKNRFFHPTFYYHNFRVKLADVLAAIDTNKPVDFKTGYDFIERALKLNAEKIVPHIFNLLLLNLPGNDDSKDNTILDKKNFEKILRLLINQKQNNALQEILELLKVRLSSDQKSTLLDTVDIQLLYQCTLHDNPAMIQIFKKEFTLNTKEIQEKSAGVESIFLTPGYITLAKEILPDLNNQERDQAIQTINRYSLIEGIRKLMFAHGFLFAALVILSICRVFPDDKGITIGSLVVLAMLGVSILGFVGLRRLGYFVITEETIPLNAIPNSLFFASSSKALANANETKSLLRMEAGTLNINTTTP